MARYTRAANTSEKSGLMRSASWRTEPESAMAAIVRTGRPTAETMKPARANGVLPAAWTPRSGARMRLPAPKNMEKSMTPTASPSLRFRRCANISAPSPSDLTLPQTTRTSPIPRATKRARARGRPQLVSKTTFHGCPFYTTFKVSMYLRLPTRKTPGSQAERRGWSVRPGAAFPSPFGRRDVTSTSRA